MPDLRRISGNDRWKAIGKAIPGGPPAARVLLEAMEARSPLPEDAVWASFQDQRMICAGMLAPTAGRTATLLSGPHTHTSSACLLIERLLEVAKGWDVDLVQALQRPEDKAATAAHLGGGLEQLADLHTLIARLPRRPQTRTLPGRLSLVPASDEELIEVLEATYVDTADCPKLQGLRRTQDILSGHRSGGKVHDDLWVKICEGQQDVGCILVTCGERDSSDLAYLGICKNWRSQGIATNMLDLIMHRAATHGKKTMRLAVDANNTAALTLYRRAGFSRRATQRAFIRSVRTMQVGTGNSTLSTSN